MFFLGAAEGVAAEAARRQVERLPGLSVAGIHHGYFDSAQEDQVVRMVSESGAQILLVAMGAPRQEVLLYRHRDRLGAGAALGVGGSFDVWAGTVKRAPTWTQTAKVEWLYRLVTDPRRVGRQAGAAPIRRTGDALVARRLRAASPRPSRGQGRPRTQRRRLLRYLISGYYGEGNAGDEAILAGILQEVGRHDPDARFTVLSFSPSDTERRHAGTGLDLEVISTSLRSPGRLWATMRSADLLISGGGSFLHEADFESFGRSFLFREGKVRPVPYFLSIVFMARAAGLPVMWYSQGLGPLHTRSARRLVAAAGSISQVVTWRDQESARLAYEVGVRSSVQLVVPDPAYALRPAPVKAAARLVAEQGMTPGARYLAVCPRPWLQRTVYLERLGEALEQVAAALDLAILLVPLHETLDPPVCEVLAARPGLAGRAHILPPGASPTVLAAVLGGAEVVVAMRLHGGILAATAGAPVVTMDYDPKTRAFATQTKQLPWVVSVDALEDGGSPGEAALVQAIVDTASHVEARRAALARAVAPLRAESGRTARLAVQLAALGVHEARRGRPWRRGA